MERSSCSPSGSKTIRTQRRLGQRLGPLFLFSCVYTRVCSNSVLVFYGCILAILRPCAYDASTTCAGMRDRDRARVRRGNCLGEVSLHAGGVHHRTHNRHRLRGLHPGRAAEPSMRGLLRTVHVLAICCVIAVLAWTKARGITFVIPYFPHRRNVTAVCSPR